jgi:transposase
MSYLHGVDRAQAMFLPETIEQYVPPNSPARAIDAFVDTLDLRALKFARHTPAATGRPPYAPADLLKLYLWGYLNRVCSSRKLETECTRNLELIWLLCTLRPDFKTIADFRRDNAEALKAVFRDFVLLCRDLRLIKGELVATDGTKLKASNHPTRRADAESSRLGCRSSTRGSPSTSKRWSRARRRAISWAKSCRRPTCRSSRRNSRNCAAARPLTRRRWPSRRRAGRRRR